MEIKILQVFLGEDNLPYKDKERTVHFPIVGAAFKGASNTTKIRFYYDKLVEQDDEDTTTWVAVSKLPNGKIGSKVLESEYDEELEEHYALFELESFYTQYKGDLFISLQGYQGGVQVITDQDTGISQIVGTPTIQATGSIKLAINYATQFIGSGETSNVNFQRILADLGTKLDIRTLTERVDELPTVGQTNVFYAVPDESDANKVNIYVWNGTTQSYVWVGDNSLYLGDYYTKQEGQDFEQEIRETIGNGSPKGVYATLADLQAAYPTGTNGIYVVSANGHWYYWNGSVWTDGGVYQATEIADDSVFYSSLAEELKDYIKDRNDIVSFKRNYFNKTNAINNKFYDGSVGNQITQGDNYDYWCCLIDVEYGKTYRIAQKGYNLFEIDNNGIILSQTTGAAQNDFIYKVQNASTTKIAISIYKYASPTYTVDNFVVTDPWQNITDYVAYPYSVIYNVNYLKNNNVIFKEDLSTELSKIADVIYNYFNKSTAILNAFYEGSVGEQLTTYSNGEYWCGKIDVEYGKTYVFARSDFYLIELDENGLVISKTSTPVYSREVEYTPSSPDVKQVAFSIYIYASQGTKAYTPDTYMVLDEDVSFDKYINYPYDVFYNTEGLYNSGAVVEKIYYVGAGKDFETFIGALRALANDKTPKIIYVMPGVYDIYEELGGKDYLDTITESTDWKDVSVFVPDNTKIIGLGDVTFNYLPDAEDFTIPNQVTCVSPLNTVWNCEIENIKIYGRNCRYCIHDEAGSLGDGTPKRKKYKNVVAIKVPNTYHPQGTYISGQAYASGMITGYCYEYENCYFKSQENYAWTCHTGEGDYTYTGNNIVMKNCIFESPNWAGIRFGSTQGTPEGIQKYCKVDILNCYIQHQILLTREAAIAPAPNQYDLTLMNCNNVTITDDFATHGWTNIYTPKIYNPIGD